jgi:Uncharacterized membrane-associated protein/domain
MNLSKLLLNPARLRILQYIEVHGEATTSEVCRSITDIPKATVYKHTKLLEVNGLLRVVKENRVRGAVEKVYSVNREPLMQDAENLSQLASGYFLGLMRDIELYLKNKDADVKRDMIFFNTAILYVTDDEYRQLLNRMMPILYEYLELKPSEERKARRLSMISSLPTD